VNSLIEFISKKKGAIKSTFGNGGGKQSKKWVEEEKSAKYLSLNINRE
jgi:hypothetical protein